ncbi:MAG: response regulator [Candidatus Eremiobacteraeota bacterium]|nr:response regulator [Candidatus Eremiobacteraeota bacterium]
MSAQILVIDDNQTNLDLIVYLLHAFGHTATGAMDGLSGLAAAQAGTFDLVLTDILMPGIDGFEFVKRFKADTRLHSINLVAVTALAMVGDRERVLAAGFDGYISKPIEPDRFVSEVDTFLPAPLRSKGLARDWPASGAEPAAPPSGATVLVVDDVQINIDVLRGVLQPFGYTIHEAHNAPSAMKVCSEIHPDLVLCDLHMAGGDGFDLLRQFKGHKDLHVIPVLLLSSTSGNSAEKAQALKLGAVKFLTRPIEPRHLLTEIKEALKR